MLEGSSSGYNKTQESGIKNSEIERQERTETHTIKQQFVTNPVNITPVNFTTTQGVSRQIFQGDNFSQI